MGCLVGPLSRRLPRAVSNAARQRAYRARNGARTGEHGPKATAPCGTVSAYKRHLRHGEATCAPCAAAWATYQRERYHARKINPRNP